MGEPFRPLAFSEEKLYDVKKKKKKKDLKRFKMERLYDKLKAYSESDLRISHAGT